MIEIIKEYLSRNRRLVVPQLGAFVVKEPDGVVVFSELLKRDDGVLRELLVRERGMNDLEAAGAIDRFVFEVRHALEHTDGYRIRGFGRMSLSSSGAILFHHDVGQGGEPSSQAPEAIRDHCSEAIGEPGDGNPLRAAEIAEGRGQEPDGSIEHRKSADAPNVSPSVKLNPPPYVKGLQYGRPQKNRQGYGYVGAKPRRRVDFFVIVATVVAVLAIAAIVYGHYRSSQLKKAERDHVEQPEQSVLPERDHVEQPEQSVLPERDHVEQPEQSVLPERDHIEQPEQRVQPERSEQPVPDPVPAQ